MKDISVSYEKFNKAVKPFIVTRYGRKVSVIPYVEAADYIFKLNQRIARQLDITKLVK